jgi:hypothetical protein
MASWLDIKAMLYKLLSVLSTILLLVIIMRNPMLWDEDYKELKHVVPKHTNMTRQVPAASAEIRYRAQIDLTSEAHQKKVFQYLRDTVLHDSQITQKQESAVTPLHKTMLLMGCYGDRWGPARHGGMHSIDDILSQTYMQHNTSATPAFFVNLMLQAFEANGKSSGTWPWTGLKNWRLNKRKILTSHALAPPRRNRNTPTGVPRRAISPRLAKSCVKNKFPHAMTTQFRNCRSFIPHDHWI